MKKWNVFGLAILSSVAVLGTQARADQFHVTVDTNHSALKSAGIITHTHDEDDWVLLLLDGDQEGTIPRKLGGGSFKILAQAASSSTTPTFHVETVVDSKLDHLNLKVRLVEKDLIFSDIYELAAVAMDKAQNFSAWGMNLFNQTTVIRSLVSDRSSHNYTYNDGNKTYVGSTTNVTEMVEKVTEVSSSAVVSVKIERAGN